MTFITKAITTILVIPCLISAQIRIEIQPGTDDRNAEVVVSGSDRAKTNSIDTGLFNLTANGVKRDLISLGWYRVGEININYASAYGYKDLFITLKPKFVKIESAIEKVVVFKNITIINDDEIPRKFRPELQNDVTETITTKWSDKREISAGYNINHVLGFNRIEHAFAYGQDDFASKVITLNVKSNSEIVLNPGETLDARIEVKETTLEISVNYEMSLDGDFYINYYCIKLVEYCFRARNLDVQQYFSLLNFPSVVNSTETITFTYYHDPQVHILSNVSF